MKLGTSTNIVFERPDGSRFSLIRTLEFANAAGFQVFDLNCYDWTLPGSPMLTAKWRAWIDEVAEFASQLQIEFDQMHAYFYNFLDPALSDEEREWHQTIQDRSFQCCSLLGGKTWVLHPETHPTTEVDIMKKSREGNYEYFSRVIDVAVGYGARIALENMCDYSIAPKRKFCAYPEELIDFVSGFKDERIGICWDFEHGQIMQQDQNKALRAIGSKLFATHVSETFSRTDNTKMHVLPMAGTMDWSSIVQELGHIRYDGIFCLEAHNFSNRVPDAALPAALTFVYQLGSALISEPAQR